MREGKGGDGPRCRTQVSSGKTVSRAPPGTSLVVQGLRPCTSTAGGEGLTPGLELRSQGAWSSFFFFNFKSYSLVVGTSFASLLFSPFHLTYFVLLSFLFLEGLSQGSGSLKLSTGSLTYCSQGVGSLLGVSGLLVPYFGTLCTKGSILFACGGDCRRPCMWCT